MLDVQFTVFPQLETERCLLRQVEFYDAPDYLMLRSDDRVMRFIDRDKWQSIQEAEENIRKIHDASQKGEGISWAVCLKADKKMIGMAGLWRIMKEHYRAEIGYTLMPEFWNKGLMTEILKEIIRFGFYEINLHSIEANINPENVASRKTLEKNGFRREAYFRENYFYNGRFLDSEIWCLLTDKK
jgi:[ribosomal protein S5]-alanine N-acetyltransferase